MIVRHIQLGPEQDPDKFAQFMREKYVPDVYRGSTRVGQVSYVEVFRGNTPETIRQFILLVEGVSKIADAFVGPEATRQLKQFNPQVQDIAEDFRTVALWTEDTPSEIKPTM